MTDFIHQPPIRWYLRGLLTEIADSVALLDSTFHHIYREANAIPDSLAYVGRSLRSIVFYGLVLGLPLRSCYLFICDARTSLLFGLLINNLPFA